MKIIFGLKEFMLSYGTLFTLSESSFLSLSESMSLWCISNSFFCLCFPSIKDRSLIKSLKIILNVFKSNKHFTMINRLVENRKMKTPAKRTLDLESHHLHHWRPVSHWKNVPKRNKIKVKYSDATPEDSLIRQKVKANTELN